MHVNHALVSILKSPILHFILLGLIAFSVYTHLNPPDRETIRITTQTIDALVQQRESIAQKAITPETRQSIIEGHIEDEVLLREAYKRGFDKNDYRVRKRILNIMRTSLTEVIPEPSVAQLRAFYEANRDRYLTSPSRSFEQVYFSFASTKLPGKPEQFITQLQKANGIAGLGDFSLMLSTKYNKVSFQTIAMTFGKPFADVVFDIPLDEWRGPVESFQGIHYVRVTAEHEPELPPFEQMESYLRTDYLLLKGRESQVAKINELRQNYHIVVEGN
ncbi:hypothetical protein D3OALGA1CA_853 [Olavius algarvensis associated proteobacterium Delta 3]|nr:hypothetical protein D3OALGA1CA_853 [Olavius algarvensis associated proteobacterium Delta 3]CAB5143162.1 hypothetical protein D3OALGB2SA_4356 [Olavius algarvensis associated proteobacterium Delta 3]